MNASTERSRSFWARTTPAIEAPPLEGDASAEVVVIGAGIAGLGAAYELTRAGKSVIVLDRGTIGGGMSGRTTAHLSSELDDYYFELIEQRGVEDARLLHESQAAAIDRIEEISADESIDCDFQRLDGYLFPAPGVDPRLLEREFDAWRQMNTAGVEWADAAPIKGADTGRCLRFARQGRFHPLKYLAGLAARIQARGGRLFAHTAAVQFEDANTGVVVTTDRGFTVKAAHAVVASNSPVCNRVAVHTKQAPYRTYVIAAPVPKDAVVDALLWDTLDPYHYVRLQPLTPDENVLIVGGEDHKTAHAADGEERFSRLEGWARALFPEMRAVSDRWSGQVMEPVDYVGFIGRNHGDERTWIATGDSGQGMTTGVVASLLLRDLILGRDNPWARLYDPRRVTVRALPEFAKENLDVVGRLAEHLTGSEVSSVEALGRGQGAVLRQGLGKIAVFRDDDGRLHARGATCTHAGCVVHWNPVERCWDCPCHGSHFAIDGSVLNGPATKDLAPADLGAPAEAPAEKAT